MLVTLFSVVKRVSVILSHIAKFPSKLAILFFTFTCNVRECLFVYSIASRVFCQALGLLPSAWM